MQDQVNRQGIGICFGLTSTTLTDRAAAFASVTVEHVPSTKAMRSRMPMSEPSPLGA